MEDDHVDRPGVEAQQCVKLTGTNSSIGLIVLIDHAHQRALRRDDDAVCLRSRMSGSSTLCSAGAPDDRRRAQGAVSELSGYRSTCPYIAHTGRKSVAKRLARRLQRSDRKIAAA